MSDDSLVAYKECKKCTVEGGKKVGGLKEGKKEESKGEDKDKQAI